MIILSVSYRPAGKADRQEQGFFWPVLVLSYLSSLSQAQAQTKGSLFIIMEYSEYLKTDHWKKLAEETKRLAGYRCAVCNADGELHAHHRTYERNVDELQSDLVCLCKDCHEMFHGKQKESTEELKDLLDYCKSYIRYVDDALSSCRMSLEEYSETHGWPENPEKEQTEEKEFVLYKWDLIGEFKTCLDIHNRYIRQGKKPVKLF